MYRCFSGGNQIWRTCIPNGKGQVRTDCTKVVSGEGDMEVCTCYGNLCNGANKIGRTYFVCFGFILFFGLKFVFY